MAAPLYSQGEVLLAWLVFSDGQGTKRRPVLLVRDFGDADLLIVPITSQLSPARRGRASRAGFSFPASRAPSRQ